MKKYTVIWGGKEKTIELTPLDDHRFEIAVEGVSHAIDLRFCTSDSLSMLMDNQSCDLAYLFLGSRLELHYRNQYFLLEVLDERQTRIRRIQASPESSGAEIIKSVMPGKIVQILVKPGEIIKPGAGILIIEAMKMENEIYCRNGGLVRSVNVVTGQTVECDVVLVEIVPE